MKTQPWQRAFTLFEQALEQPSSQRSAFLDEACGADSELRRGVERLIAADAEDSVALFERPILEPRVSPLSASDAPPGFGKVGSYRILHRIGQGGMSTVYLAVRDDDAFERRVVVKVVRSDRRSDEMLRRLRAERRILANLEHPHIARLYDGGNTEEGLPYFVLEYVEGVPIDRYCVHCRLSVDDRLTLFRKVCAAVHYAHQNLVVHRDIKPSNILVTADGEPKLLDFGIAKVLNPGMASTDVEPTAAWLRLLTPSHASPEQIHGQLVTTVSDVYSLGVLLFQLLTGRLPYDLRGRAPHEIEQLLTETDPPKPSQVVAPEPPDPGAKSYAASSAPSIRRALSRDLDAIVLKALRSVPAQRYASAERFADDIERLQRGLPVAARGPDWRYRSGRFVRRHRVAATALVVMIALVAGFVVALALQAEAVAAERDQALKESAKKSQVVDLMLDIFELGDPYVVPDAELTVRQALEHSLPHLTTSLSEQPEVRADLLHTTGSIFSVLGVFDRAVEQLTEALEIRSTLYGDRHPTVAETMSALAGARMELDEDLGEAEALARRAVEVLREQLGPENPELTEPLVSLIAVLCLQEAHEAAEPLVNEALGLARQLPRADDRKITVLEYLAHIHSTRGDYREAVALNREALALSREIHGESFPGQIATLSNLGFQLRRLGDFPAAQVAYEDALELHRSTFGEDYADLILLGNFAGLQFAMGRFSEAESSYREALRVVHDRYGERHWRVLSLGLRLARTRTHQGFPVEAERQIRALLARRLVGADHRLNDEGRGVLGESLSAQGRCEEAEALLVESFESQLKKAARDRARQDALARLREHLVRCGKPQEIPRYSALLEAESGSDA